MIHCFYCYNYSIQVWKEESERIEGNREVAALFIPRKVMPKRLAVCCYPSTKPHDFTSNNSVIFYLYQSRE